MTQDFGVAAMALSKNAAALNQNGLVFTAENIDRLLFERHIGKQQRRNGKKAWKNCARTKADDAAFIQAFVDILDQIQSGKGPYPRE